MLLLTWDSSTSAQATTTAPTRSHCCLKAATPAAEVMSKVAKSSTKPLLNTALLWLLVSADGLPDSDNKGDEAWNACTTAAAFGVDATRVWLQVRGSPPLPFRTFRAT